jgi:hypothetical protein
VGQEYDRYDPVVLQYMRSSERGIQRPVKDENGESIRVPKSAMYLNGSNGVWKPNDFMPNLLKVTKPLLDRSNTPRGALRSITLDRNFSQAKWLYNKTTLDKFDPNASKKDLQRSKTLRKIQKRQEKQKEATIRQREAMGTMSSGFKTSTSLNPTLRNLDEH